MSHYDQILAIWSSNTICYATHNAKARFVVTGNDVVLPACGDHVSRAILEVCQEQKLANVTVWCKP